MIRPVLDGDERFEVVGEAGDPYDARDLIKSVAPDVLTLDVEMPRMNGLVFLRNLMRLRPMPVVMVSTRTSEQSEEAIAALSLGAVDCIDLKQVHGAPDIRSKLTETLLAAANASLRKPPAGADVPPAGADVPAAGAGRVYNWQGRIAVVGSSTGGVDASSGCSPSFRRTLRPLSSPSTCPRASLPASRAASRARSRRGSGLPKAGCGPSKVPFTWPRAAAVTSRSGRQSDRSAGSSRMMASIFTCLRWMSCSDRRYPWHPRSLR